MARGAAAVTGESVAAAFLREKDRMRGVFLALHLASGPVEGAMAFWPGEINVVKRMAYRFRDDHDDFLKIPAAFPGNPG